MANEPIEIPKLKPAAANLIRERDSQRAPRKVDDEPAPLAAGQATKAELSFGQKLRRSFVKEDMTSIRDYVVFDIIIPQVKQSIFDSVVGTVGQLLGVARHGSGSRSSGGYTGKPERPFVDYSGGANSRRVIVDSSRLQRYDPYDTSDVTFRSKDDAMKLLEEMIDVCDSRGWYSVARFYRRAGIPQVNNGFTNEAWGWRNVDGAGVVSVRDGYIIDLPKPETR